MIKNIAYLVTATRKRAPLIALFLLFACPLFGKRKDDVVVMKNGDKFTGEIKSLQYGELVFKSDYMKDSVHLDWKQVQSLQSQDAFIVTLSDGERVTGFISKERDSGKGNRDFKIVASASSGDVSSSEVILIGQRESSFWKQLTGSVSYGFGFASGNSATNSSLAADVAFSTTKNSVKLATSSQFDSQANANNTNRITFDSQYGRALTNKWLAAALFSLLKSNQQELNLRSTYCGGVGRKLVRTDKTVLTLLGGAAYSHESYTVQAGVEPVRNKSRVIVRDYVFYLSIQNSKHQFADTLVPKSQRAVTPPIELSVESAN